MVRYDDQKQYSRYRSFIFLLPGFVKPCQRETETELLEFSQNMNREELTIKRSHFAMASLCNGATLVCIGYVSFEIAALKYDIITKNEA